MLWLPGDLPFISREESDLASININDYKDSMIAVLGMGKSGVAMMKALREHGFNAVGFDENIDVIEKPEVLELRREGMRVCAGKFLEHSIRDASLIITSPGLPSSHPFFQLGIPVISEVEAAFQLLHERPSTVIGVTGTNGKSTVVTLLGKIFEKTAKTVVAGNIGNPLSGVLNSIDSATVLVLELSSFQLYFSYNLPLDVSVILNITPDHFDWHRDMDEYVAAKQKILEMPGELEFAVLNYEDDVVRETAKTTNRGIVWFSRSEQPELHRQVFLKEGTVIYRDGSREEAMVERDLFRAQGEHNTLNLLAAVGVAVACGVPRQQIESGVLSFVPLPHRMQQFKKMGNTVFIDDSKATNTGAAVSAIKSLPGKKILLAGGKPKESSFGELVRAVAEQQAVLIAFGESRMLIAEACKQQGVKCVTAPTLKEAVDKLVELVRKHRPDYVLLSPGCASFDEFSSYAERGSIFQQLIKERFDD